MSEREMELSSLRGANRLELNKAMGIAIFQLWLDQCTAMLAKVTDVSFRDNTFVVVVDEADDEDEKRKEARQRAAADAAALAKAGLYQISGTTITKPKAPSSTSPSTAGEPQDR
jgi:hypothetical protein